MEDENEPVAFIAGMRLLTVAVFLAAFGIIGFLALKFSDLLTKSIKQLMTLYISYAADLPWFVLIPCFIGSLFLLMFLLRRMIS